MLPRPVLRLQASGWMLLGHPARARRVFDRWLQRWPGDAAALGARACLHARSGSLSRALADAQAATGAPGGGRAADWFNLGFLLQRAGRARDAEAALRQAVAFDPTLDRAWYGLGLVQIGQGRADDAIAALTQATRLQPMSPHAWYQLARLHADRGAADEVQQIVRHLRAFEPAVAAQLERETGCRR